MSIKELGQNGINALKMKTRIRKELSAFINGLHNGPYKEQFEKIHEVCNKQYGVNDHYQLSSYEIKSYRASLKSYWYHFTQGKSSIVAKPDLYDFAYMRRLREDLRRGDGDLVIKGGWLLTRTLLKNVEKAGLQITREMLEPLQSKPKSSHPDEKILVGNVETTASVYNQQGRNKLMNTQQTDPVNQPPHYKAHPSGIECIQITEHMNFCLGNAVKYLYRNELKHANPILDLQKAEWYVLRYEKREMESLPKGSKIPSIHRGGSDEQGDSENEKARKDKEWLHDTNVLFSKSFEILASDCIGDFRPITQLQEFVRMLAPRWGSDEQHTNKFEVGNKARESSEENPTQDILPREKEPISQINRQKSRGNSSYELGEFISKEDRQNIWGFRGNNREDIKERILAISKFLVIEDTYVARAMFYIWRSDLKNDAIEDLEKAKWYITREIEKRKKDAKSD